MIYRVLKAQITLQSGSKININTEATNDGSNCCSDIEMYRRVMKSGLKELGIQAEKINLVYEEFDARQ